MYVHTKAFLVLRRQTQGVLDFAVLICNSVPLLKMALKNIGKNKKWSQLARPDYFKGGPNQDQLREFSKEYKENLSKYLLLSLFSYFEAYVIDSIKEIFEFHGGKDALLRYAHERCKRHVNPVNTEIINNRRKLQDAFSKHKTQKYKKYTKLLKIQDYKFPSELLSPYGILKLSDDLKDLKSVEIPNVLIYGLHLNLSTSDVNRFHSIRDTRNKIAHGESLHLDIRYVMNSNKFLRELAVRIDRHIVDNFFVIEKFT